MVTVNPWLLIFSFVYFFLTGFLSYFLSVKVVDFFIEKTLGSNFSKAEPVVGSSSFIIFYGVFLFLLYIFLNWV